jgi:hypothetical protein
MANINISDLQIAGLGLFSDSENYMSEVTEGELSIQGGFFRTLASKIGSGIWDAISYAAHAVGVPEKVIRAGEDWAEELV